MTLLAHDYEITRPMAINTLTILCDTGRHLETKRLALLKQAIAFTPNVTGAHYFHTDLGNQS